MHWNETFRKNCCRFFFSTLTSWKKNGGITCHLSQRSFWSQSKHKICVYPTFALYVAFFVFFLAFVENYSSRLKPISLLFWLSEISAMTNKREQKIAPFNRSIVCLKWQKTAGLHECCMLFFLWLLWWYSFSLDLNCCDLATQKPSRIIPFN